MSTFTPGKISSKFTERFERQDQSGYKCKYFLQLFNFYKYFLTDENYDRPPKKILLNAETLFSKVVIFKEERVVLLKPETIYT